MKKSRFSKEQIVRILKDLHAKIRRHHLQNLAVQLNGATASQIRQVLSSDSSCYTVEMMQRVSM